MFCKKDETPQSKKMYKFIVKWQTAGSHQVYHHYDRYSYPTCSYIANDREKGFDTQAEAEEFIRIGREYGLIFELIEKVPVICYEDKRLA